MPATAFRLTLLAGSLASLTLVSPAQAQTMVPANAANTCSVSAKDFKTWFASGKVTPNGFVNAANSLNFNHDTINPPKSNKTINCNFYQWSQQMFLWISSPAPAQLGGRTILDSSVFYDVLDGAGDSLCLFNPVTRSNSCSAANGLNANRIKLRVNKPLKAQVISSSSADAGTAQADRSASLMGQNNKLVYYTLHVNDVYAYYASANGTQGNGGTLQFPTTQAQLQSALDWAKKNNRPVPDPNALALELKASWVEASGLDSSKYVTTVAEVPTFDTSNPKQWVQNGSKQTLLALVGLHVVGSVAGHPEMIWATYEHINNTPNAAYQYVDKTNKTVSVAQGVPQNMLFAANGSKGPFNQLQIKSSTNAQGQQVLSGQNNGNVAASDTLRTFPWGADQAIPLLQGLNAAQANTEVIAINNSVRGMLGKGDVRQNYLFIGATWTPGGVNPYSPFGSQGTVNYAGSNTLANSTMETYVNLQNKMFNCFSCHFNGNGANGQPATVGVSHIYNSLTPFNNSLLQFNSNLSRPASAK
ncbi:hypothetical protein V8J88_15225 [Massilia sp. W12]|uniref:hypothetical protein n=1 Tax=Massilia sp. W12 TaxID=3126507 RepID=UPI0030CC09FB